MPHPRMILIASLALVGVMLPLCGCSWRDPVTQEQLDHATAAVAALSERLEQARTALPRAAEAVDQARAMAIAAQARASEAQALAERIGSATAASAAAAAGDIAARAEQALASALDLRGAVERQVVDLDADLRAARDRLAAIEPGTPAWQAVVGTIITILLGRFVPGSERLALAIFARPAERDRLVRAESAKRGQVA